MHVQVGNARYAIQVFPATSHNQPLSLSQPPSSSYSCLGSSSSETLLGHYSMSLFPTPSRLSHHKTGMSLYGPFSFYKDFMDNSHYISHRFLHYLMFRTSPHLLTMSSHDLIYGIICPSPSQVRARLPLASWRYRCFRQTYQHCCSL